MGNQYSQTHYFEKARYRRPQDKVIKAYVQSKLRFISKYIKIRPDMKILDVGCGNGIFTFYYSQLTSNIMGIDLSMHMLRENPSDRLVRGDARRLPFRDEYFNIVFEANLLHHTEQPKAIIREMKRVTKSFLVFLEPNRLNPLMFLFGLLVNAEKGVLRSCKKNLERDIRSVGLELITCRSMGTITQNNTPQFLLPFLRPLDREFFLGQYIIAIAEK